MGTGQQGRISPKNTGEAPLPGPAPESPGRRSRLGADQPPSEKRPVQVTCQAPGQASGGMKAPGADPSRVSWHWDHAHRALGIFPAQSARPGRHAVRQPGSEGVIGPVFPARDDVTESTPIGKCAAGSRPRRRFHETGAAQVSAARRGLEIHQPAVGTAALVCGDHRVPATGAQGTVRWGATGGAVPRPQPMENEMDDVSPHGGPGSRKDRAYL